MADDLRRRLAEATDAVDAARAAYVDALPREDVALARVWLDRAAELGAVMSEAIAAGLEGDEMIRAQDVVIATAQAFPTMAPAEAFAVPLEWTAREQGRDDSQN